MKLVVTGGAGFIGNHTVRMALGRGHDVVSADALTSAASLSAVWDLDDHPRYRLAVIDMTEPEPLARLLRQEAPDAIIHLAAETDGAADPAAAFDANCIGTLTLLETLRHVSPDCRLIVVEPPSRLRNSTEASFAARAPLLQAWRSGHGLSITMVESAITVGPGQARRSPVGCMISQALAGLPITVSALDSCFDLIHVADHAEALLNIAEHPNSANWYGVGLGVSVTQERLARALCRLLQAQRPAATAYSDLISVTDCKEFGGPPIDASALRSLGWKPKYSLEDGLADTVAWALADLGAREPVPSATVQRHEAAA